MSKYTILGGTGNTGRELIKQLTFSQHPQHLRPIQTQAAPAIPQPLQPTKRHHIHRQPLRPQAPRLLYLRSRRSLRRRRQQPFHSRPSRSSRHFQRFNSRLLSPPHLKSRRDAPASRLLSSLSVNPELSRSTPVIVHWLVCKSLFYLYDDLKTAERTLRMHKGWLDCVFVQPGMLSEDPVQRDHVIGIGGNEGALSFADLAAGMIEIAGEERFAWMGVCVGPKSGETDVSWRALVYLVKGLVWGYVPGAYAVSRMFGLV